MKIIQLFIAAILISFAAQSQTYSPVIAPIKWTKGGFDSLFIPVHDTLPPADKTKGWIVTKDSTLYQWQVYRWKSIGGGSAVDLSNYIQKQTQNPTASLSPGGLLQETLPAGADLSATLTWTAGRVAATTSAQATANISTISVAGNSESFSNPSAGSTVSGTQGVTYPRNTTTTFTMTVTTSDSKTATATSVYSFSHPKYWFTSTTTSPSNSEILAGSSDLLPAETKVRNSTTITVSGGNKYLNYAYPAALGSLSSINIGGFESIGSFTQSTVSVTSGTGAVVSYYIYTSNNLLPTTTINSIQ